MTYTTYTGTYTAPIPPCTYTHPTDLHACPRSERETTYTGTYTTYTRDDLHAGPPLFRGGPVVGRQARPEAWCPSCGRTAPAPDQRPARPNTTEETKPC